VEFVATGVATLPLLAEGWAEVSADLAASASPVNTSQGGRVGKGGIASSPGLLAMTGKSRPAALWRMRMLHVRTGFICQYYGSRNPETGRPGFPPSRE